MKRTFSRLAWLLVILSLALLLAACERMLQEEPPTVQPTTPALGIPTFDPLATPLLPPGGETPTDDPLGQPTPAGSETPVDGAPPPAETAVPQDPVHTVVAGDTLGSIAQQYGVTAEQIAAANNLTLETTLDIGQQLLIPVSGEAPPAPTPEPVVEPTTAPPVTEERVHIVQAGENLYRIGLQYGFTIEALAAYNGLSNPNRLEIGQQIRIPPDGYTIP